MHNKDTLIGKQSLTLAVNEAVCTHLVSGGAVGAGLAAGGVLRHIVVVGTCTGVSHRNVHDSKSETSSCIQMFGQLAAIVSMHGPNMSTSHKDDTFIWHVHCADAISARLARQTS